MFIYDKDMERVMMAKKKEVLQEIETAKLRVLKELYCIKRGIHTDMCEMLADYNRIDFNLKKAIKDAETKLETTVKEFQRIIADALEEHNRTIDTKLNELSSLQSSVISEVNAAIADLDAMKTTVENMIAQCQELIDNGVKQADIDELRTQLEAAIATAGVQSDWEETDETNKSFIKNKPFGYEPNGSSSGWTEDSVYNEETTVSIGILKDETVSNSVLTLHLYSDGNKKVLSISSFPKKNGEFYDYEFTADGFSGTLRFQRSENPSWDASEAKYVYYWRGSLTYTNTGYADAIELYLTATPVKTIPIDPKFIAKIFSPNSYLRSNSDGTVGWTNEIYLVSPTSKMFKLTVSDDGVLSATAVTD